MDLVLRFVLGGAIVSLFAVIGQLFKPPTFAGLFGAAPSVALASLTLLVLKKGTTATAREGHAMVLGALALAAYSAITSVVLRREREPVWLEVALVWGVWLALALPAWWVLFR